MEFRIFAIYLCLSLFRLLLSPSHGCVLLSSGSVLCNSVGTVRRVWTESCRCCRWLQTVVHCAACVVTEGINVVCISNVVLNPGLVQQSHSFAKRHCMIYDDGAGITFNVHTAYISNRGHVSIVRIRRAKKTYRKLLSTCIRMHVAYSVVNCYFAGNCEQSEYNVFVSIFQWKTNDVIT